MYITTDCRSQEKKSIERMTAEIEDEAAFRAAIKEHVEHYKQEDCEVIDGELRVTCLEAESQWRNEEICALKDAVRELHDAVCELRQRNNFLQLENVKLRKKSL